MNKKRFEDSINFIKEMVDTRKKIKAELKDTIKLYDLAADNFVGTLRGYDERINDLEQVIDILKLEEKLSELDDSLEGK